MITITKEHHYKTFLELSEEQQEKLIEKNRDIDTSDDFWFEWLVEEYTTILEILGFVEPKVYFSLSYSQGDGACFVSRYFSYEKGMGEKIRKEYGDKELVELTAQLQELYRRSFYQMTGKVTHRGHYYHERSMDIYLNNCEHLEKDFEEWCADFSSYMFRKLRNEYEYLTSYKHIRETLEDMNEEYEVDIEGNLL